MFTGVDRQICATAWDLITLAIAAAADMRVTNKHDGTIFVLDPTRHFAGEETLPTDALLFAAKLQVIENEKYTRIAEAKAYVSWRTGLPSREVQQRAPHLYVSGMTKWGGSRP